MFIVISQNLIFRASLISVFGFLMCALMSCSTTPQRNLDAERIDLSLQQLEEDPTLGQLASAEVARAREAVATLATSTTRNEVERNNLIYLAEKRSDIATTVAKAILEERKLVQLEREASQIELNAARKDATQSRIDAERLRLQSLARQEEAERAQKDALEAYALRDLSAEQATQALAQANQAKRLANAQAEEATLAKKEAELAIAAADSLRQQMQNLTAIQEQRGQVMTLSDNVFLPGKSTLLPDALASLDKVVSFVNPESKSLIRIEGYTDSSGSANFNQSLSQKRAESVRDALIEKGIDINRITVIGMGEENPIASNNTPSGRAKNRRVEIILEATP